MFAVSIRFWRKILFSPKKKFTIKIRQNLNWNKRVQIKLWFSIQKPIDYTRNGLHTYPWRLIDANCYLIIVNNYHPLAHTWTPCHNHRTEFSNINNRLYTIDTKRLHLLKRSNQSINSPSKRLANFQVHAILLRPHRQRLTVVVFFPRCFLSCYGCFYGIDGAYWCYTQKHTHTIIHTPSVLLTFEVEAIAEYIS